MALESGTFIDSLNASNPTSTDMVSQADDHLRLIKIYNKIYIFQILMLQSQRHNQH